MAYVEFGKWVDGYLSKSRAVFSYKNVRVRWGKLPEKVHFGANFLAQSKAGFNYKNVRVRWGKLSVKVTFRGTFSGRKWSFSITKGVDARGASLFCIWGGAELPRVLGAVRACGLVAWMIGSHLWLV